MRGQRVARSDKVKYLGVWVDEGLTWKDHTDASFESEEEG